MIGILLLDADRNCKGEAEKEKKKQDKTIKQRLSRYMLSAMTAAIVVLMLVLGGVGIGFLVKLTNELQDADIFTDDVQTIASSAFDEKSSKYVTIVDSAETVIAHKNKAFIPYVDGQGIEHLTSFKEAIISACKNRSKG